MVVLPSKLVPSALARLQDLLCVEQSENGEWSITGAGVRMHREQWQLREHAKAENNKTTPSNLEKPEPLQFKVGFDLVHETDLFNLIKSKDLKAPDRLRLAEIYESWAKAQRVIASAMAMAHANN